MTFFKRKNQFLKKIQQKNNPLKGANSRKKPIILIEDMLDNPKKANEEDNPFGAQEDLFGQGVG